MTYVVTYIDVQPSSTSEVILLITQYCEGSRAEEGHSGIDLLQELTRQNRFVVVEAWDSDIAFQSHEGSTPTIQFRSRLGAIHNSPADQRVHHDFAGGPQPA